MSDEQKNVGAGSETSGETDETTQVESTDTTTDTAQTDTDVDAGGATDATEEHSETSSEQAPDPSASRTGFVEGSARTGDACVCPDGRPGTVNVFAGGLAICLPNQG